MGYFKKNYNFLYQSLLQKCLFDIAGLIFNVICNLKSYSRLF